MFSPKVGSFNFTRSPINSLFLLKSLCRWMNKHEKVTDSWSIPGGLVGVSTLRTFPVMSLGASAALGAAGNNEGDLWKVDNGQNNVKPLAGPRSEQSWWLNCHMFTGLVTNGGDSEALNIPPRQPFVKAKRHNRPLFTSLWCGAAVPGLP